MTYYRRTCGKAHKHAAASSELALCGIESPAVNLWRLNSEPGVSSEHKEICVAANQNFSLCVLRQVKEHLIFWIPAADFATRSHLYGFAPWKVFGQKFQMLRGREPQLRIAQNAYQLTNGSCGNQRNTGKRLPVRSQPRKAALAETKSRNDGPGIKNIPRGHGCLRAHVIASCRSSSVIPSLSK